MTQRDNWENKHLKDVARYVRQIEAIYRSAVRDIASIGAAMPDFNPDKPFSFADYPNTRARMEKLLKSLKNDIQLVVLNGIEAEWTLANNKNNELCNVVFGKYAKKLTTQQERRYYSNNDKARKAFAERKVAGLDLSDRVWRYTDQFKSEMEMGLDLGLRDGLSADEMSRTLRQYLQQPDRLFRRVKDEHGLLHLSKQAKAYHPGQGVYRSSYKNARRLAATETNIAYRTSDYTRWQQLDFVVGIEVKLSNNHTLNGVPFTDICDDLAGKYPKDFKFTGWHPHCRCYAVSILKTPEEMEADNERIMAGEPLDGESVNKVDDVPDKFSDWLTTNKERIERSKSLPYFMRDNEKYCPQMHITQAAAKGVKEAHSLNDKLVETLQKSTEKGSPLKLKDPDNITDEEVKDTLITFADNNPGLFIGGLKDVKIVHSEDACFFMANSRSYTGTGIYNMAGNTIKIVDKDFKLPNGETFNPFKELKGAFKAISTGVDMTFKQEYAIESLWHEMRHSSAVGWKNLRNKTPLKRDSMETINQFCARHSYKGFVQSLGGKAVNTERIIEQGYGYGRFVSNFQSLLKHINVTQSEAHAYFKDMILETPYEEIYGEIVKYVRVKSKYDLKTTKEIVKNMIEKPSKAFTDELQKIKRATGV